MEAKFHMVSAREASPGHDDEPILQMGTDKMIPRHVFQKHSKLGFQTEVNEKEVPYLLTNGIQGLNSRA
jgi:hypothetical protein